MASLVFHKCVICGAIFYSWNKTTYCTKCVPRFRLGRDDPRDFYRRVDDAVKERTRIRNKEYYQKLKSSPEYVEERRAKDRLRWKFRMTNPAFREAERRRSAARYKAKKEKATL